MTVGTLKKLLDPLEDALEVIVVGPCIDEDGDDCETWFAMRDVTVAMDAGTAEEYARLACARMDEEQ